MKVGYITILNHNFGDALNEPLLSALSSYKIDFVPQNKICSDKKRISAIGSVAFLWTGNTTVWGSGVLDVKNTCPSDLPLMDFKCVRGPKTRDYLIEKGYVNIPEIYCDPAIICTYFYRHILSNKKNFDFGVFPHNTENLEWFRYNNIFQKNSILLRYNEPIDVTIRKISQCKVIISSSLHGIIIAESLGIPCIWYRLTDINDPFKFHDYFEGTRRKNIQYVDIRNIKPNQIDFTKIKPIPFGCYDICGLLDSCPFDIDSDLKKDIIDYYTEHNLNIK